MVLGDDGAVDETATLSRREVIREERGWTEAPLYGLGEAREAYSAVWSSELEDAISQAVADMPVQLMQFLHGRLIARIQTEHDEGRKVAADAVPGILDDVRREVASGMATAAE